MVVQRDECENRGEEIKQLTAKKDLVMPPTPVVGELAEKAKVGRFTLRYSGIWCRGTSISRGRVLAA